MAAEQITIGLDFDRASFDTKEFYKTIAQETGLTDSEGKDMEDFKDAVQEVYDEHEDYGLHDPESIEKHVQKLEEKEIEVDARDIRSAYKQAPKFLHNEEVLEQFSENYHVVAVTRATHRGWQELKMEVSGFADYVDEERVVEGHYEHGETKYFDDLDILIDDNINEIQVVQEHGLPAIHLNRQNTKYTVDEEYGTVQVETLQDAYSVIEQDVLA